MFNISVFDDNILEYNETLTITFTIDDPTLSDRISTDTTTVIIIDNDRELTTFTRNCLLQHTATAVIVEFGHPLYHVKEDHAEIQFALLSTNPSAFEIIVYINVTDITALGKYYYSTTMNMVFAIIT